MAFNRWLTFLLHAYALVFLCSPNPALAAERLVSGMHSPFLVLSRGFYWSAEPLLNILNGLNQVTGGHSISLVLLACSVTVLLLPYHLAVVRNVVRARQMHAKLREIEQLYGAVILRDKSISEIQFRTLRENGINPLIGYLAVPLRTFVFFTLVRTFSFPGDWDEAAFFGWVPNVAVPDPFYIFPLAIVILAYSRQSVEGMQMGIWIPLVTALVYAGLPVGVGIYSATRMILILGVSRASAWLLLSARESKD